MHSSSSDEEENAIVRRPRIFRARINYGYMQETYEYNESFHLTYNKFIQLLLRIEPFLEHKTSRNKALTPKQQLQIALHWMGTGSQYHSIADMHGVSKATVCRTIRNVVNCVNEILFRELVRWPQDVDEVITKFSEIGGMPLIMGAIDGTLIDIDAPNENEPAYVDRFGNHSLNIMLVCGPDYQFYYVSANWPGSVSDARVLRNSALCHRLEQGWRPFPNTVLLGDSIYPLKTWLIPPVLRNGEDPAQQRFCRAHKKTRRVIECAIGILKEKFTCLSHLRLHPVYACNVIKCCVALCNLSKDYELNIQEEIPEDHELGEQDVQFMQDEPPLPNGGAEKLEEFYRHFQHI